jgi:L,D-peptidoglycan transpeptidase YkuD (ErfK/YbiS/YcfS/YnhG family)
MEMIVTPVTDNPSRGILKFGSKTYPCALGKKGVTDEKVEGDQKSPAGKFNLRSIYYRYDKLSEPIYSKVPLMALLKEDGWCDDPADHAYNKPVMLPYHASAEHLWREDDLYDILVVLGYNDQPTEAGKGSAIFLHVARDLADDDYKGSEGCVTLNKSDLIEILPILTQETCLQITLQGTP